MIKNTHATGVESFFCCFVPRFALASEFNSSPRGLPVLVSPPVSSQQTDWPSNSNKKCDTFQLLEPTGESYAPRRLPQTGNHSNRTS